MAATHELPAYIGRRAITVEDIRSAMEAGATDEQIVDRLTEAECRLSFTHNEPAWREGWKSAVRAVRWLTSDANTDEIGLADLLEQVTREKRRQRRHCYQTAVLTGTPELDEVQWSTTAGRCDCCSAGMLMVEDTDNDWEEIAEVLSKTFEGSEVITIAAKRKAQDAFHAFQNTRWTPFGYINPFTGGATR